MPYSYLSIESVLSLAVVVLALGTGALSLLAAFGWRRRIAVDQGRNQEAAAGLFVFAAAFMMPVVMAFLGGLLLLFAPPSTPAPIRSFGATPQEAAMLVYGLGGMVVVVLGVAAAWLVRVRTQMFDAMFSLVIAVYLGASAVFSLLLMALLFAVGGSGVVGGTFEGAGLMLLASLVSLGISLKARGWIRGALSVKTFDAAAWGRGALFHGGAVLVVSMPLAVTGAVLIAS